MDIGSAISEPFVNLLAFHNSFNLNIKISIGALFEIYNRHVGGDMRETVRLPNGGEPWGLETRWKNIPQHITRAASFVSEMGIARVLSAFEDYTVGAKGEFDRAGLESEYASSDGNRAFDRLDALLGIKDQSLADIACLSEFFREARNCIVHRSNRANRSLKSLRDSSAVNEALGRWSKRKTKWKISLPDIDEGKIIEWRPRHAIFASDVYYRAAAALDRNLIEKMGPKFLAKMAAYWCFFADSPTHCPAKHSPEIMVRTQLMTRYNVRDLSRTDTINLLREADQWANVQEAWEKKFPKDRNIKRSNKRS